MKRSLIIFLLTICVLSNSIIVFAQENEQYLTRIDAAKEIVTSLYSLDEDTNFSLEMYYCLHPGGGGYVHFVPDETLQKEGYPLLCEIYTSVNPNGFTDISDDYGNLSLYITLAKAMGIINGHTDNTFRPDELITYNEAIKMLVSALNTSSLSKPNDGYPEGYIASAEIMGITAGIRFDGDSPISREDFKAMLANALNVSYASIRYLMVKFMLPVTPEQCAKDYAQAVMDCNGGLQYALLDTQLKDQKYDDFAAWYWVTGTSSPWVSEFEINLVNELTYEINFHYATSTGPAHNAIVKLTLKPEMDGFRLANIELVS